MTATVDDRIVLAAVGATGAARTGPIEAQIPAMPAMPPPDECTAWGFMPHTHDADRPPSWMQLAEMRHVPEGSAHLGAHALGSAHARGRSPSWPT